MSYNPHTGAKLISKPSTSEYETNWELIFGAKKELKKLEGEEYLDSVAELEWPTVSEEINE
jgi:hypothetical protein